MTKNTRFSPEVRQRAARMVIESQNDYDSQWAAISSIARIRTGAASGNSVTTF